MTADELLTTARYHHDCAVQNAALRCGDPIIDRYKTEAIGEHADRRDHALDQLRALGLTDCNPMLIRAGVDRDGIISAAIAALVVAANAAAVRRMMGDAA